MAVTDKAPQTFSGNCMANTVPAASERYLCPIGANATLQTDPDLAEIYVEEDTVVKDFRVKTTSAQPAGNYGLQFHLIINGSVVDTVEAVGPLGAAGSYEADFPNGPFQLKRDDRLCLGVLNTGSAASAKIGAFGLG